MDQTRAVTEFVAARMDAAVALLQDIARSTDVPQIYARVAGFRALMLQSDLPAADRRMQFETFLAQGGILRLLAEEQLALIDIETGESAAALARAQRIREDAEASAGLRERAAGMIMALGGEVPQAAMSTTGAVAPVQD